MSYPPPAPIPLGRRGRQAPPINLQAFAEAGPGPSTEDIEEQSARSTRGTRCELKQLDGRFDHLGNYNVTDSSVSIVGDAEEAESHAEFALVSTRMYGMNGLYQSTQLEIKSRLIKRVLRRVIKYYPGQPIDTAELILQDPPKPLFHYRQELEDYRHTKADDDTKKHLDLLFKFVDSLLKSQADRYKDYVKRGIISFSIVWMLFRPGDLVFTLKEGQPTVLLVQRIDACRTPFSRFWRLTCLGIDCNGVRLGKVTKSIKINDFEGTRDIIALNVYPLKYHPEEQKVRSRLLARGNRFLELQGCHHMSYKGQAFVLSDRLASDNSLGFDPQDDYDGRGHTRERLWVPTMITGRIMVDSASFSRINTSNQIRFSANEPNTMACDCSSCRTSGRFFMSLPAIGEPESAFSESTTEPPGDLLKDSAHKPVLSEKHTLLCPPFVLGFSLQSKKWCRFFIDLVKPLVLNDQAFDELIIDPAHKELVLSIVESHVANDDGFDDIISGKGKSLIILLHGAPGVGKTLTAESIADHTRRPLYMISSGELGTHPAEVEDSLSSVLDIATTWNAVVLLDEADVFLQQRGGSDISRNALVSIFLRLLEYYEGILFLTSNRVLSFDLAFKSRIHIALHYPALNAETRRALWSSFLLRLPAGALAAHPKAIESTSASTANDKPTVDPVPAQQQKQEEKPTDDDDAPLSLPEDLDWLQEEPINGRQIKNAVKTAAALARRRGQVLKKSHLKVTLNTIREFEMDFGGKDIGDVRDPGELGAVADRLRGAHV